MKRALTLLFWTGLSAGAAWGLRGAPLAEMGSVLRGLHFSQVAALLGLNTLILILFSSRWWLILRAQGYRVPYLALSGYRLMAFAVSYFTPGTQFGGEPLQVYLVQRRHRVPGAAALASVTLDKLFELLANFTFLAVGIILAINSGLYQGRATLLVGVWSGVLLVLPLAYLLALAAGRQPATALLSRLPGRAASSRPVRRFRPLVASAEAQSAALFRQRPGVIAGALLLSGWVWVLLVAEYWLMLSFLGAHLGILAAISLLVTARLAFLTPIPGGLGALEAGQVLAAQALGLPAAFGLSLSFLIRGRDLLFGLLGLALVVLARREAAGARFGETGALESVPVEVGD